MDTCGQSLNQIVQQSDGLRALPRDSLQVGDMVYARTCNSLYCIRVEGHRFFSVSGGWFDRSEKAPMRTAIIGCTWGGSIIKIDVIAAVGLSIEFSNRVTTSPIQKIILIPRERQN
jgi:hypothetical protein